MDRLLKSLGWARPPAWATEVIGIGLVVWWNEFFSAFRGNRFITEQHVSRHMDRNLVERELRWWGVGQRLMQTSLFLVPLGVVAHALLNPDSLSASSLLSHLALFVVSPFVGRAVIQVAFDYATVIARGVSEKLPWQNARFAGSPLMTNSKKVWDELRAKWPTMSPNERESSLANLVPGELSVARPKTVKPENARMPAGWTFLSQHWTDVPESIQTYCLAQGMHGVAGYHIWRFVESNWDRLTETQQVQAVRSALNSDVASFVWDFFESHPSALAQLPPDGLQAETITALLSLNAQILRAARTWQFLNAHWMQLPEDLRKVIFTKDFIVKKLRENDPSGGVALREFMNRHGRTLPHEIRVTFVAFAGYHLNYVSADLGLGDADAAEHLLATYSVDDLADLFSVPVDRRLRPWEVRPPAVWRSISAAWDQLPSDHKRAILGTGLSGGAAFEIWKFVEPRLLKEPGLWPLAINAALQGSAASMAIAFLSAIWQRLSAEQREVLDYDALTAALLSRDKYVRSAAWKFARVALPDMPETVRTAITATIMEALGQAYVSPVRWHFLVERWRELPESMVAKAFIGAMRSANPAVAERSRDFVAREWSGFPAEIRRQLDRARLLESNGFPLLPNLLNSTLSPDQLRQERLRMEQGGFDLNNPVHIDLNYPQLLKELSPGAVISGLRSPKMSYLEYTDYVARLRSRPEPETPLHVAPEHLREIRGLAYEAHLLRKKILELQAAAERLGRGLVVVENLSYGAVALAPITEERSGQRYIIGTSIPVWSTKIGSTESHHDEAILRPDLFTASQMDELIQKQPLVAVVDGSTSVTSPGRTSAHIPDGFKGYRSHFIAINTALGFPTDADGFQMDEEVLQQLTRDVPAFATLVQLYRARLPEAKPYSFFVHYPGEKTLHLRSDKQPTRPARKLGDISEIQGPALIILESVIEQKAVPENVLRDFIGGAYHGGFFDDQQHYKEFFLDYEPGYGIHVTRSYINQSRQTYRELLGFLGETVPEAPAQAAAAPAQQQTVRIVAVNLNGVLAEPGEPLSERAVRALANLLDAGLQVVLMSEDTEKQVDKRLAPLITRLSGRPAALRNLWTTADGGGTMFHYGKGRSKNRERAYEDISGFSDAERYGFYGTLEEEMKGRYALDGRASTTSERFRIDLRDVRDRDTFIADLAQIIDRDALGLKAYKVGGTSVKVVKRHTEDAVRYVMRETGSSEEELLIVADSARTNRPDRRLLGDFPAAVSVNVGKASRSMSQVNPGVFQTEGGVDSALVILEELPATRRVDLRPLATFRSLPEETNGENGHSSSYPLEGHYAHAPFFAVPGVLGILVGVLAQSDWIALAGLISIFVASGLLVFRPFLFYRSSFALGLPKTPPFNKSVESAA